ncbi:S-type pyocin domain-containing protein, partial [Xenorhabdus eapokensis]|uniref:S-type pyocin domain-containing protein n=1 Tax=Xenorhabdus eapokensis TaxID=1873482 RepID=UPI000B0160EC
GPAKTTTPVQESDFRDYILVFPIEGVPAVYVYLSENSKYGVLIWTKGKVGSRIKNAINHWLKHGNEFPNLKNSDEYIDATHDFIKNPPKGTLSKENDKGDKLFYDPDSNTFAVQSKSGAPRTMFKPKAKMKYWSNQ